MKNSYLTATDQFCGAGGSSCGLVAAGIEIRHALNHWDRAIETYNTNHPQTRAELTNVRECDPRRYLETDILISSPECTNHSLAKGVKRKAIDQFDMFAKAPDPEDERSRATMWDVPRFAEVHRYNLIIVENVVEARLWSLWDAWMHAMRLLGYNHRCVYFNSMFSHPVPQSRDRMYVVFWKKGNRAPDLEFTPPAFCYRCEANVEARQTWKNAAKLFGKYRRQYTYNCPRCYGEVTPYYHCALNCIDFTLPIERIGDRKKPLKEKTRARLLAGMRRYANEALLLANYSPGWARPVTSTMGTVTTKDHHALAIPPFLVETAFKSAGTNRTRAMVDAMPTQTSRASQGLFVPPSIINMMSHNRATGMNEPVDMVLTGDHKCFVMPQIVFMRNNQDTGSLADPINTVCAGGGHHGLLLGEANSDSQRIAAFVYSHHTRLFDKLMASASLTDSLPTVPASMKHALPISDVDLPDIDNCYFRMFQPNELKASQAFSSKYVILGNKREQVRQIGHAVPPPTMQMLIERGVQTFR